MYNPLEFDPDYHLPATVSELRERDEAAEQFDYLFFFGHRLSESGEITKSCLSQWYRSDFTFRDVTYPTAEHWMMAEKARLFNDEETLAKILETPDPRTAKQLGRTVANFDEQIWKENARRVVENGNLLKFLHNEDLRNFLLNTGEKILVEASPYDNIWGIGVAEEDHRARDPRKWRGENLLGFSLMRVRYTIAYYFDSLTGLLRAANDIKWNPDPSTKNQPMKSGTLTPSRPKHVKWMRKS